MRQFNYALIKDQKWDSELLGIIAADIVKPESRKYI